MRFSTSWPQRLIVLGVASAALSACTTTGRSYESSGAQARRCAPQGQTVDSSFVAAQAVRAISGTADLLRVVQFQAVRAHGLEVGIVVSVVRSDATVGGGGLVWVDSESACAILLRRYE